MAKSVGIETLMAKVKESSGFSLSEKGSAKGVAIPHYGERYIRDSNIYMLDRLEMYAGDPSAGKSSYAFHVGVQFLKAGGWFIYIETENKFSETTIRANMGKWADHPRFVMVPVVAMTMPTKKKGAKVTTSEDEVVQAAWMDKCFEYVTSLKKAVSDTKDIVPIYIAVDSLLGSAAPEQVSKAYEEGGGAVSPAAYAQRAQRISNWIRLISTELKDSNILLGITNHIGKKISMDGKPIYGSDTVIPGGTNPRFFLSLLMLFNRGGREATVSAEGRNVTLRIDKNSYGSEGRDLKLSFIVELAVDENGKVILDDMLSPQRIVRWKWEECSATILCRFFDSSMAENLGPASMRKQLSIKRSGTTNNYRYTVPDWGLEEVTAEELDKFVNTSEKAREDLQSNVLTSINTHRGIIVESKEDEEIVKKVIEEVVEKKPRKGAKHGQNRVHTEATNGEGRIDPGTGE